jgi:hypothetical protein
VEVELATAYRALGEVLPEKICLALEAGEEVLPGTIFLALAEAVEVFLH